MTVVAEARVPAARRRGLVEVHRRERRLLAILRRLLPRLPRPTLAEWRSAVASRSLPADILERIAAAVRRAERGFGRGLVVGTPVREQIELPPISPAILRQVLQAQLGALVRDLTLGQLQALQELLAILVEQGATPDLLRSLGRITGLTRSQVHHVARVWAQAVARGVAPDVANRLAGHAAERALAHRSQLIARTEAVRFTNAVIQARGEQLGPGVVKRWLSARDVKVDQICRDLDNEQWIPIHQAFPGGLRQPPAHPGCRCILELEVPR